MVYVPIVHMYGLCAALLCITNTSTLHIMEKFDLNVFLQCVSENKVCILLKYSMSFKNKLYVIGLLLELSYQALLFIRK